MILSSRRSLSLLPSLVSEISKKTRKDGGTHFVVLERSCWGLGGGCAAPLQGGGLPGWPQARCFLFRGSLDLLFPARGSQECVTFPVAVLFGTRPGRAVGRRPLGHHVDLRSLLSIHPLSGSWQRPLWRPWRRDAEAHGLRAPLPCPRLPRAVFCACVLGARWVAQPARAHP